MSIPFTDVMQKRGFGFAGTPQVCSVQPILKQCPTCWCTLTLKEQKITLDSLIDTGANVILISQAKWPSQWSLAEVLQALSGIGGSSRSCQSHHLIQIKGPEGRHTSVILFVLPVPMVLWWGDVLSQWGFRIQSAF